MRASVQYHLQISYAEPVRAVNQVLRLNPRGFDGQEIKDWRVDVLPDARMRRSEDAFGNIVHSCSHDGPLDPAQHHGRGRHRDHDVAGVVHGLSERFPLEVYLRDAEFHARRQGSARIRAATPCPARPIRSAACMR